MCNQLAIKLHTQPLDEVLCEAQSHINTAEGAAYAWHSAVGLNLIHAPDGLLNPQHIAPAIKPAKDWLPRTSMLVVENTANMAGGNFYPLVQLQEVALTGRQSGLAVHLDGARIFNALTESGGTTQEIGPWFDTLSVCLSKGLGAPVGSLLIGSSAHIAKARRLRKALGGGMRQTGMLAAAGLYALQNNISRLSDDHRHAQILYAALKQCSWVTHIRPVKTNIVIFDVVPQAQKVLDALTLTGIRAAAFGPHTIRFVTHLDVSGAQIDQAAQTLMHLQNTHRF
jgi:threonine aldolase